ncbi:MAG: hypothetical protein OXN27_04440 [Candidatus Poribacteria bacterium]|nr:hypothetical protein [Candidatus Poribacteria bacterium]
MLHFRDAELADKLGFSENISEKFMNYEGLEFGRYHRSYAFNMPYVDKDVSTKFDYPENDELAIVISIFEPQTEVNRADRHIHAKSAVYAALSLIENTDVRETGTKIYFVLNEGISDIPLAYLRAAKVPDDNILYAPMTRSSRLEQSVYGTLFKVESLLHERLREKERIMFIDSDVYFLENLKVTKTLIEKWDTDEIPLMISESNAVPIDSYPWGVDLAYYEMAGFTTEFYQDLSSYLGTSVSEVKKFTSREHKDDILNLIGWATGISGALARSPDFRSHLQAAYEKNLFINDESFFWSWFYMHHTLYLDFPFGIQRRYTIEHPSIYHIYIDYDDAQNAENQPGMDQYLKWRADFEKRMTALWK